MAQRLTIYPLFILLTASACLLPSSLCKAEFWLAGFAKEEITPTEPLRLSGYSSRTASSSGVADSLHIRVVVISPNDPTKLVDSVVLACVDSIATTNTLTVAIAKWLEDQHGIPRSQLVISSSHSHAAPHLSSGLPNLYRDASTQEQSDATERYTAMLETKLKQTIETAITNRVEASVLIGEAKADFAVNRRVIGDGQWTGFGVVPEGLVDKRVRVMQFTTPAGKLLGASFMYACHCTTLGPSFNEVSGDWAGLAASRLEQLHEGAIFLPVIGCGADANPNPRDSYAMAQQHAAAMVDAVQTSLANGSLTTLQTFPTANFGFAGLVPERPTDARLQELLQSESPSERRWAESMQDVKKKMGRIPESYPMPIHTWKFGEQLTWVFLGGEVVADYQFKIESQVEADQTWVAAYCDDVFAYVSSEAMLSEGGYEVDQSMIYYLQPGRWESGTQDLILRRVAEILRQERSDEKPLTAPEACAALRVPEGYRVELVASEPLIQDPINIAFGRDGRVWLVEMSDYPLGTPGGGRIKWLRDNNQDGILDECKIFLEGLSYPTSVMPWRDGVIVIAAPDVFYAEDVNDDGVADRRETLLTGIGEANPQHRASGFEIGLDGWLHFGSGDDTRELHSLRNGKSYEIQGHDIAWHPDTGEIRTTTGETQFVRARDAFGNWFGNSNSYPMYQYVIDQHYFTHASISGGTKQHLLEPAAAPPVHPRSRTVDRFNDQFARERFTSACSSIVARVPGIMPRGELADERKTAFICEPVHNLVARISINSDQSAFVAISAPDDSVFGDAIEPTSLDSKETSTYDFLTSTDLWSRPVRVVNAPDGTIWVLDMVRRVIEHPQWIPTAWQERLDLRSGANLGRIYRIYRDDFQPTPLRKFDNTAPELLTMLSSDNGVIRDLALQTVCTEEHHELENDIREIAQSHRSAAVRASALGCLKAKGWLTIDDVVVALTADNRELVRFALTLAEDFAWSDATHATAFHAVVEKQLGPQVDLQWVLTSTQLAPFDASRGVADIAKRSPNNLWIQKALTLVMGEKESLAALISIVDELDQRSWENSSALDSLRLPVHRLWQKCDSESQAKTQSERIKQMLARDRFLPGDVLLISAWTKSTSSIEEQLPLELQEKLRQRLLASDDIIAERLALLSLLGTGAMQAETDRELLESILSSSEPAMFKVKAISRTPQLRAEGIPQLLLSHWSEFTANEREGTCSALLEAGNTWTNELLEELEAAHIQRHELGPVIVQQLRNLQDKSLRSRAEAVLGKPTARAPLVTDYLQGVEQYFASAEFELAPSKLRGAQLFAEHCSTCHVPKDGSAAVGPAIDNLSHWTHAQWVIAVMDPNQTIEPKFQQNTILTTSGQILNGIIIERSSQLVRIAMADGTTRDIPRDEIEDLKRSPVSLMPEGLEAKLSPRQLGDIIAYLRSK